MTSTVGDGGGLFLQPPHAEPPEHRPSVADESGERMRRLRFPFEADPADVADQDQAVPVDEDDYR